MAHQRILGYSVPDDGVENVIRYNQGYSAMIKQKDEITVKNKSENAIDKHRIKAKQKFSHFKAL